MGLIRRRECRGCLLYLWQSVAAKCPDRKDCKAPKTANMVVSEGGGTSRYGNFLTTVLSVCSSPEWWIDTGANVHVCADISMFSSYQVGGLPLC
jgi:hypothetical protein